jgi:hypothetical protein
MGDFLRKRSQSKKLLQLKQTFSKRTSFLKKKSFSLFSVLIIGTGAIPILPHIDTEVLTKNEPTTARVAESSPQEELCYWQQDFTHFSRLLGGESAVQEEVSCRDEVIVEQAKADRVTQNDDLREAVRSLTEGYPIEMMASAISVYDRQVAGLIVGIAKKESNWGKRVPRDALGDDCFNYWGWKGAGTRGMAMGHGCFGSPEEAVAAVGNRITQLVDKKQTSEPQHMTVWKCGSSCATHSPESVRKWIADVDLYYRQIVKN